MTLNEARDEVVAACRERRTVIAKAEAVYLSYYDGEPRARHAVFTITIYPIPFRVFTGPDLEPLVAQAVAFVSQPPADPASDAPAACEPEPPSQQKPLTTGPDSQ